jgi:adenine phosphoribosyltransferase
MMGDDLRSYVRDVPDFPRPGILFRDLTPMMGNAAALKDAIDRLADVAATWAPEAILGIESRGFIFGAPVAARLGVGFVPLRKPGKLPFRTRRSHYDLEYGSDGIEIHEDSLAAGSRVAIVDDLLATGGTAGAAVKLARELGAIVVGAAFVIELAALGGRERLAGVPSRSLLVYTDPETP